MSYCTVFACTDLDDVKSLRMSDLLQPRTFLKYLNPDGGLPYSPGMPSFSEPTLLMILGLIAAGADEQPRPLRGLDPGNQ